MATSNSVGLLIQNWPLYFKSEILKRLEESNKYAPNFFSYLENSLIYELLEIL
jgi:hypothetical protein